MDNKLLSFNIFRQINNELRDYFGSRISISGKKTGSSLIRYLSKKNSVYSYNQAETISIIDMYWNSKFSSGERDDQNRQKLFMNVGKFRSEVGSKQTDIDAKNFLFYPEDYASTVGAWLMQQEFKNYTKDTYFGELINECVENFPKYGTIVLKKVGKKLEFVPLQTLRNDQSARDLNSASYVIEEHPDMSFKEISDMKKNGWNIGNFTLPFGQTTTVYERTGTVPLKYLNELNDVSNEGVSDDKVVDAIVICTIDKTPRSKKNLEQGHTFYAKEISDRPYREAHWSKQHGRWLGVGEMENQIPNQVAKNVIVNILKNAFEWSSKRIFQSQDDGVANNIAREVKDGDVLLIEPNGEIKQVDMAARFSMEAQQMMNEWEKNSDQKSFTYEVATGEALPSGTPFRLGVVLSNAANNYFALKREKLGILLKKAVLDFLIPDFIKKAISGKSTVLVNADMPGYEVLRKAAEDYTVSQVLRSSILSGKLIDMNLIKQLINPIQIANQLFIKRPADFYNNIKTKFDLTITGEATDIEKKITSLTTLYQILQARGDPRAEAVLERVLALSGENISSFGVVPPPLVPGIPPTAAPRVNVNVAGKEDPKSSLAIPETTQTEGSK